MTDLAERAAAQVRRINAGEVSVRVVGDWPYCGNADLIDADGWRYVVFSDCDEFDYFDSITSPAGERLEHKDGCEVLDPLCAEIDDHHLARWGIA